MYGLIMQVQLICTKGLNGSLVNNTISWGILFIQFISLKTANLHVHIKKISLRKAHYTCNNKRILQILSMGTIPGPLLLSDSIELYQFIIKIRKNLRWYNLYLSIGANSYVSPAALNLYICQ